ncbi:uncharacterized protein LOC115793108 [Archocentrus centrarchus]|uniref:uncharacterized protein LOC115793108 n=1 Tax=Archocentrus centrarchus TaxID=63155 RepID=UPI0011E9DA00|nr:uncharacterized protein LOC115793108 [Archocentrus centrarchus]
MDPVALLMWNSICVCLSLTSLIFCWVCCLVQRGQAPIIYYANLLFSNLIQPCAVIVIMAKGDGHTTFTTAAAINYTGVLASLYFKMWIVLDRYFYIAYPLVDCIRQTKGSVLVCVLVWVLCVITAPLAIFLDQFLCILISALLPAPLFIFSLAGTIKILPAATSVPIEEKRRILGMSVLLLLNYFLMTLPVIVCYILHFRLFDTLWFLFLTCPLMDLSLFFLMGKGVFDKLLACLCYRGMDDAAADHPFD